VLHFKPFLILPQGVNRQKPGERVKNGHLKIFEKENFKNN
jgi:hypothetical protein